ncbi:hypothetical protein Voc01_042380 [Virgisporangium ochraceum]|uniref:Extracellular repeat protein, HAF family n=1 Tax=Virgisporangium ochraceum TaxID=65505 RepID=A0A8J3ZXS3_9ACTN|nr:hypothetical protein Voc01_042380 [Virgisporangium ochraceum]
MATGREKARQRRIRRVAGTVALGLAAIVAVPGAIAIASRDRTDSLPDDPAASASASASGAPATIPDAGPDACRYHLLPVPDDPAVKELKDPQVVVSAVDPTGRWAVGWIASNDRQTQLMILWENGKARLMPPETKNGHPIAVNEQGQVLGKSGLNEYGAVGSWVYRNGSFDRLGIPAGYPGHDLNGINAAGDVLGYVVYHQAGATGLQSRVAVWKAGDLSTPQLLPNPRNALWGAERFGSDGTILGSLQPGMRPYVWAGPGTGRELSGPSDTESPRLRDSNGDWVVGDTGTGRRVFRWRLSTGERTEVPIPSLPGFRAGGMTGITVRSDGEVAIIGRQEDPAAGPDSPLLLLRNGQKKVLPAPDGFWASGSHMSTGGSIVYGEVIRSLEPNEQKKDMPAAVYWTC